MPTFVTTLPCNQATSTTLSGIYGPSFKPLSFVELLSLQSVDHFQMLVRKTYSVIDIFLNFLVPWLRDAVDGVQCSQPALCLSRAGPAGPCCCSAAAVPLSTCLDWTGGVPCASHALSRPDDQYGLYYFPFHPGNRTPSPPRPRRTVCRCARVAVDRTGPPAVPAHTLNV